MSAGDWQGANDAYLAAALHWLRLRLARQARAQQPPVAEPEAPAPAEPAQPRERARRWPGRPQAAPAGPEGPLRAELPPPQAAAGEAEVAEAEAAMLAAEHSDAQPALLRLGELLELSTFERHMLLLCAAMELDPSMPARCA
jgi:hypothetical protein